MIRTIKRSRIAIILAAALLCLGFSFSPIVAAAEEPENGVETSEIIEDEEVVEETESVENTPNDEAVEEDASVALEADNGKSFEENVETFIWQYGAVILGGLTAAFIVLKKLVSVVRLFSSAVQTLMIANKKVEDAQAEMEALRKENAEHQEEMDKHLDDVVNRLIEGLKEALVEKVDDIDAVVHKILDVEEIAYESNPSLVGNGTAKKISEVIRK